MTNTAGKTFSFDYSKGEDQTTITLTNPGPAMIAAIEAQINPRPAFNLSAEMLLRAQYVATDASRTYLQGAFIEPLENNGALIIATNGRLMLVQHDKDAIAPEKIILKLHPAAPDPGDDTCEECGNYLAGFDFSGMRAIIPHSVKLRPQVAALHNKFNGELVRPPAIHALAESINSANAFPDWRKVIGAAYDHKAPLKQKTPGDLMLDPALLQQLAQWSRGVKLHYLGETNAAPIVTFEDNPNAFGAICYRQPDYKSAEPLAAMLSLIGRGDLIPQEGE